MTSLCCKKERAPFKQGLSPNQNNGTGIKVISNSIDNIPNYPTCVQKYVKNPLLIDGYKVRAKNTFI